MADYRAVRGYRDPTRLDHLLRLDTDTSIPLRLRDQRIRLGRFVAGWGDENLPEDIARALQQLMVAAVGGRDEADRILSINGFRRPINAAGERFPIDGIVGERTAFLMDYVSERGMIQNLQRRLRAARLYHGAIDGIPGIRTLTALAEAHADPERYRSVFGVEPPIRVDPAVRRVDEEAVVGRLRGLIDGLSADGPSTIVVQGNNVIINGVTITGGAAQFGSNTSFGDFVSRGLTTGLRGQTPTAQNILTALQRAGFNFGTRLAAFREALDKAITAAQGGVTPPHYPPGYALDIVRIALQDAGVMGGNLFSAEGATAVRAQIAEAARLALAPRVEALQLRLTQLVEGPRPRDITLSPDGTRVQIGRISLPIDDARALFAPNSFTTLLDRLTPADTASPAALATFLHNQNFPGLAPPNGTNRRVVIAALTTLLGSASGIPDPVVEPRHLLLQALHTLLGGNPLQHQEILTEINRLATARAEAARLAQLPRVEALRALLLPLGTGDPPRDIRLSPGDINLDRTSVRIGHVSLSLRNARILFAPDGFTTLLNDMQPRHIASADALIGFLRGAGFSGLEQQPPNNGNRDLVRRAFIALQTASRGIADPPVGQREHLLNALHALMGGNPLATNESTAPGLAILTEINRLVAERQEAEAINRRRLEMRDRIAIAEAERRRITTGNAPATIQMAGERLQIGNITISATQAEQLKTAGGFDALVADVRRRLGTGFNVTAETAAQDLLAALEYGRGFDFVDEARREAFLTAVRTFQGLVRGLNPPLQPPIDVPDLLLAGLRAPGIIDGNILLAHTRIGEVLDANRSEAERTAALERRRDALASGTFTRTIQLLANGNVKIGNVEVTRERADQLATEGGFAAILDNILPDAARTGAGLARALIGLGIQLTPDQSTIFANEVQKLIDAARPLGVTLTTEHLVRYGLGQTGLIGGLGTPEAPGTGNLADHQNISLLLRQADARARLATENRDRITGTTGQPPELPQVQLIYDDQSFVYRGRRHHFIRMGAPGSRTFAVPRSTANELKQPGHFEALIRQAIAAKNLGSNPTAAQIIGALTDRDTGLNGMHFISTERLEEAINDIMARVQGNLSGNQRIEIPAADLALMALARVLGGSPNRLHEAIEIALRPQVEIERLEELPPPTGLIPTGSDGSLTLRRVRLSNNLARRLAAQGGFETAIVNQLVAGMAPDAVINGQMLAERLTGLGITFTNGQPPINSRERFIRAVDTFLGTIQTHTLDRNQLVSLLVRHGLSAPEVGGNIDLASIHSQLATALARYDAEQRLIARNTALQTGPVLDANTIEVHDGGSVTIGGIRLTGDLVRRLTRTDGRLNRDRFDGLHGFIQHAVQDAVRRLGLRPDATDEQVARILDGLRERGLTFTSPQSRTDFLAAIAEFRRQVTDGTTFDPPIEISPTDRALHGLSAIMGGSPFTVQAALRTALARQAQARTQAERDDQARARLHTLMQSAYRGVPANVTAERKANQEVWVTIGGVLMERDIAVTISGPTGLRALINVATAGLNANISEEALRRALSAQNIHIAADKIEEFDKAVAELREEIRKSGGGNHQITASAQELALYALHRVMGGSPGAPEIAGLIRNALATFTADENRARLLDLRTPRADTVRVDEPHVQVGNVRLTRARALLLMQQGGLAAVIEDVMQQGGSAAVIAGLNAADATALITRLRDLGITFVNEEAFRTAVTQLYGQIHGTDEPRATPVQGIIELLVRQGLIDAGNLDDQATRDLLRSAVINFERQRLHLVAPRDVDEVTALTVRVGNVVLRRDNPLSIGLAREGGFGRLIAGLTFTDIDTLVTELGARGISFRDEDSLKAFRAAVAELHGRLPPNTDNLAELLVRHGLAAQGVFGGNLDSGHAVLLAQINAQDAIGLARRLALQDQNRTRLLRLDAPAATAIRVVDDYTVRVGNAVLTRALATTLSQRGGFATLIAGLNYTGNMEAFLQELATRGLSFYDDDSRMAFERAVTDLYGQIRGPEAGITEILIRHGLSVAGVNAGNLDKAYGVLPIEIARQDIERFRGTTPAVTLLPDGRVRIGQLIVTGAAALRIAQQGGLDDAITEAIARGELPTSWWHTPSVAEALANALVRQGLLTLEQRHHFVTFVLQREATGTHTPKDLALHGLMMVMQANPAGAQGPEGSVYAALKAEAETRLAAREADLRGRTAQATAEVRNTIWDNNVHVGGAWISREAAQRLITAGGLERIAAGLTGRTAEALMAELRLRHGINLTHEGERAFRLAVDGLISHVQQNLVPPIDITSAQLALHGLSAALAPNGASTGVNISNVHTILNTALAQARLTDAQARVAGLTVPTDIRQGTGVVLIGTGDQVTLRRDALRQLRRPGGLERLVQGLTFTDGADLERQLRRLGLELNPALVSAFATAVDNIRRTIQGIPPAGVEIPTALLITLALSEQGVNVGNISGAHQAIARAAPPDTLPLTRFRLTQVRVERRDRADDVIGHFQRDVLDIGNVRVPLILARVWAMGPPSEDRPLESGFNNWLAAAVSGLEITGTDTDTKINELASRLERQGLVFQGRSRQDFIAAVRAMIQQAQSASPGVLVPADILAVHGLSAAGVMGGDPRIHTAILAALPERLPATSERRQAVPIRTVPVRALAPLGYFRPPGADRVEMILGDHPATFYNSATRPPRGRLIITHGHGLIVSGATGNIDWGTVAPAAIRGGHLVDPRLITYMSPAETERLGIRRVGTEYRAMRDIPENALTGPRARMQAHLASLAGYDVVVIPEKLPGQNDDWNIRLNAVVAALGDYTALISHHFNHLEGGQTLSEFFANPHGQRAAADGPSVVRRIIDFLNLNGRESRLTQRSIFMTGDSRITFGRRDRTHLLFEMANIATVRELTRVLGDSAFHTLFDRALLTALGLSPEAIAEAQATLEAAVQARITELGPSMGLGVRPDVPLTIVPSGQPFTTDERTRVVQFPAADAHSGPDRPVALTLSRDFIGALDGNRPLSITLFLPGHGARLGPGGRHDLLGTGTGQTQQNVAGQFLDSNIDGLHIIPQIGDSDPGRFNQPGYLAAFLRRTVEETVARLPPDQRDRARERLMQAPINLVGYSGGGFVLGEILENLDAQTAARVRSVGMMDAFFQSSTAEQVADFLAANRHVRFISSYAPNTSQQTYNQELFRLLRDRNVPNDDDRISIGPFLPADQGVRPHETLVQRTYGRTLAHLNGGPRSIARPMNSAVFPAAMERARALGTQPPSGSDRIYFDARTGNIYHNGQCIARAISGNGVAILNPDRQYERNTGPIPVGVYDMDMPSPRSVVRFGMSALPWADTVTRGRGNFALHTAMLATPGNHGCITFDSDAQRDAFFSYIRGFGHDRTRPGRDRRGNPINITVMNLVLEVVDSDNLPTGHPMAGLIQPEDRRADLTGGGTRLGLLDRPLPLRTDYTHLTAVPLVTPPSLLPGALVPDPAPQAGGAVVHTASLTPEPKPEDKPKQDQAADTITPGTPTLSA